MYKSILLITFCSHDQHQEDLHNLANDMDVIVHGKSKSIFTPVTDRAKVEFFDKEAYRLENISVINKEWTIEHVVAFLRVIDHVKLIEPFRNDRIAGFQLTEMSMKDPTEIALRYDVSIPEVEDVFNCIDDLGDVDNLELIRMINEEFDLLQEEHEEMKRQQKYHFDMIESRKAALPHAWQVLNSTKGAGIVDGEFDMVFIGMPGVGKVRLQY